MDLQIGDIEAAFYPRSALKPLQAVAMLRAGLPLDGELLALTAASHSGEERHLAGTRRILELAGLSEDQLRNVTDLPFDPVVREDWVREGPGPPASRRTAPASTRPCSHGAAQRLVARRLPRPGPPPPAGHRRDRRGPHRTADRPGDRRRLRRAPVSVSLHGLARAAARIVTAAPGTPEAMVADAMREHPEMASGSGRDVCALMRAVPGLLTKDGFEGVQVAALPDGRAVAVKIADGADRARVPVAAAALARCGFDPAALAEFAAAPLLGGGEVVGASASPPVRSPR